MPRQAQHCSFPVHTPAPGTSTAFNESLTIKCPRAGNSICVIDRTSPARTAVTSACIRDKPRSSSSQW